MSINNGFLKRAAALFFAAVITAGGLSGCSGSSEGTESADATESAAGETAQSAETGPAGSDAGTTGPGETTAAGDEGTAESESEPAYNQVSPDELAILALDPKKPENMGNIELGDVDGVEITAPEPQIIEASDVTEYIESNILNGHTRETDAAAEDGDTVNIDYTGTKDGVAFDGGSAEGYDLVLGSGSFIDGFEDGLIGAKAGDSVSLDLTFPDDYGNEELAGQAVVFDVKVNAVKRQITIEELTDEMLSDITGDYYQSVSDLRTQVEEDLKKEAEMTAKSELYSAAINELITRSTIEITDEVRDWYVDINILNADKSYKYYYGIGLADMMSYYGMTYESYRDIVESTADYSAGLWAAVDVFAGEHGLEYSEETFNQYIAEYGYEEEDVESMKGGVTQEWIELSVQQYLVGKYISDNAKVTFIPYDEYVNMNSESEAEELDSAESGAAESDTAESEAE